MLDVQGELIVGEDNSGYGHHGAALLIKLPKDEKSGRIYISVSDEIYQFRT